MHSVNTQIIFLSATHQGIQCSHSVQRERERDVDGYTHMYMHGLKQSQQYRSGGVGDRERGREVAL